jgi:hypothetical protein
VKPDEHCWEFSFKIPQPDGVVVRTLHKPFFK